MRYVTWLLPAAIGLVLLAVARPAMSASVEVGQPAPALAVNKLDGSHFDLASLRGKVVVVNYWATWCPPCREEMPSLDAFYKQYRAQGVELIGMSTDRPRDRKNVLKVMEAFGYPAAMMSDAKPNGFGAPRVLPITFVIDGQGILRAVLFGKDDKPLSIQQLTDAVQPLLSPAGMAATKG